MDHAPAPPPPLRQTASGAELMIEAFENLDTWEHDRAGPWSAQEGVVCVELPNKKQERSLIYAGSEDWGDYAVDLDVLQRRGVDKGVVVRVRDGQGIAVDLRGGEYQDVIVYRRHRRLGRAPAPNPDGQWHHLRVEARPDMYFVLVNRRLVLEARDSQRGQRRGRIVLPAYTGGKAACSVCYANVVVTTLGGGP